MSVRSDVDVFISGLADKIRGTFCDLQHEHARLLPPQLLPVAVTAAVPLRLSASDVQVKPFVLPLAAPPRVAAAFAAASDHSPLRPALSACLAIAAVQPPCDGNKPSLLLPVAWPAVTSDPTTGAASSALAISVTCSGGSAAIGRPAAPRVPFALTAFPKCAQRRNPGTAFAFADATQVAADAYAQQVKLGTSSGASSALVVPTRPTSRSDRLSAYMHTVSAGGSTATAAATLSAPACDVTVSFTHEWAASVVQAAKTLALAVEQPSSAALQFLDDPTSVGAVDGADPALGAIRRATAEGTRVAVPFIVFVWTLEMRSWVDPLLSAVAGRSGVSYPIEGASNIETLANPPSDEPPAPAHAPVKARRAAPASVEFFWRRRAPHAEAEAKTMYAQEGTIVWEQPMRAAAGGLTSAWLHGLDRTLWVRVVASGDETVDLETVLSESKLARAFASFAASIGVKDADSAVDAPSTVAVASTETAPQTLTVGAAPGASGSGAAQSSVLPSAAPLNAQSPAAPVAGAAPSMSTAAAARYARMMKKMQGAEMGSTDSKSGGVAVAPEAVLPVSSSLPTGPAGTPSAVPASSAPIRSVAAMEIGGSVVSLKCPLSMRRMRVPARGSDCAHDGCFELETYLQHCAAMSCFNCPLCDRRVYFGDLRIDAVVLSALRGTRRAAVVPAPRRRPRGSDSDSSDDEEAGGAMRVVILPATATLPRRWMPLPDAEQAAPAPSDGRTPRAPASASTFHPSYPLVSASSTSLPVVDVDEP